jgi:hypothetical protein
MSRSDHTPALEGFGSSRATSRRDTSSATAKQPASRSVRPKTRRSGPASQRCLRRKLPRRHKACLRSPPAPVPLAKVQLSQRQPYKAGIRLAVFDIAAACSRLDEFIDVQDRQVVLQLGAFAVRGKRDRASKPARSIAKLLGRSSSAVSREMRRNGGYDCYRATLADENAREDLVAQNVVSSAASAGVGGEAQIGLVTRADSRLAEKNAS